MLEYFTYRKIKKHKTEKEAKDEAKRLAEASADVVPEERGRGRLDDGHGERRDDDDDAIPQTAPVLRPEDENFLEQLLAGDELPAPPLPPRNYLNEFGLPSDNEETASASESRKSEEMTEATDAKKLGALKTAEKKPGRFALFFSKTKKSNEDGLEPRGVPPAEGERETKDLGRVLDRLNLSARNNKVVSTDSSELLSKFTQVFKDLVNGVPTAYDDLAKLVEDRDGTLSKGFDKLPSSLQKLVTQLPDKITGSLAPEILAAAASKQGIKSDTQGGVKGVAKSILMPHNLAELVSKPGAIVGMLRAIVEVLKTRWPAFIGMNVIWSVALTLLLFMLWYCHKRGREVRLEREQSEAAIDGSDRIEELPDDPTLPAPEPRVADVLGRSSGRSSPIPQMSHRPAGQDRDTAGSDHR